MDVQQYKTTWCIVPTETIHTHLFKGCLFPRGPASRWRLGCRAINFWERFLCLHGYQ